VNFRTVQYMAPECMQDKLVELSKGFDVGADVYSYAMVMWEVAHPGRIPWQGEELDVDQDTDITSAIRKAVVEGRRPTVQTSADWPPGYHELMTRCWAKNSNERPRFLADFFEDEGLLSKGSRSKPTIGSRLRKMIWTKTTIELTRSRSGSKRS
jgi:serine/threonine protein kinase